MSTKKKSTAKAKLTTAVKKTVKDVVKKEKAKVEELKAISQKAESKVAELKTASRKAKASVKSKVEEIKKTVSKSAKAKTEEVKKTVARKEATVATKAKTATKAVSKAVNKVVKASSKASKAADEKSAISKFAPEYLVLMQRDPNFLHAFWDVKEERLKDALKGNGTLVLRLYDVSNDLTVRKNKIRKFQDVEVPADAKSWYVQNRGAASLSATLGAKTPEGSFEPIVEAPAMQVFSFENVKNSVSHSDNVFFKASLGGAGIGGFGSSGLSSQSVAKWLEHLASSSESFYSGSISSESSLVSSGSVLQPVPGSVNYGKDFFLWVKTRLIVYGGTRPDAHLQVRGEPFPLNPDGTFSFEQDLPDSTQIIPVFATDKDGDFPTTIVPVVVKRTE
ncbi:MAG: DUF4912 domain-containing protein [Fibrobacter sp.]|nr:DUF4912 domain-containing protein [Fibrobacter sp.]MDY6368734.1 DUF4912 domain-containing protein [Fibrobacter sp.]MDY6389224.1 DUF4912 domain-containing protein [Fibrobacter sp.]